MFIRVNMSSRLSKKDNPASGELMDCSAKYLKSLVGAPGFEPGTSCAQGRRNSQDNPPVFNVAAETKQLSRYSSMWLAVRTCAHLSVGWAQKLAQSRCRADPGLPYRNTLE